MREMRLFHYSEIDSISFFFIGKSVGNVRRRKWQPTPLYLPGESQGQRSLVGCRLWGHRESDMTEVT